jgi:choline dehydrogenase
VTTTLVVGAGSSGGALAARLSEDPYQHVILVEAGPDYPDDMDLPSGLRNVDELDMAGCDWGLLAHLGRSAVGEPTFPYLRSRVVGGSSTVATAALRPIPEDFAGWTEAGNDQWGWESVLPYFRKLEHDLDFGEQPIHGSEGPISIKRRRRDEWPPMLAAFEDACLEFGHPACADANAEEAHGVGPAPRNMLSGGDRASSLSTYLHAARSRPNLEIRAETYVERVVFDRRRAIGVEVRGQGGDAPERILADRVVLCAGALKTPQILMLSGVGPGEQLRRLGIAALAELPVGRALVDHPCFNVIGFASDPAPSNFGAHAQLQYSSEGGSRNDIWVRAVLSAPGPPLTDLPDWVKGIGVLSGVVGKPRSVGRLELSSSDPAAPPVIQLNFLDDSRDRSTAREMARDLWRLATTSPLAEQFATLLTPPPGGAADDRLDDWLRANVSSTYHATCTCPMGPPGGPAVVDQRLGVHGTEGLYVGDASVIPEIPTSALNLACFMIGERLADWLKAE